MITYNEIYTILRQEKYNEPLQKLPKNFFEELKAYIADKKKIFDKERESGSNEALEKLKRQFENAKSLIRELFEIRQKKIFNLVFLAKLSGVSRGDYDAMLDEEKELFNAALEKVKEVEARIHAKLEKQEERVKEAKENEKSLKTCLIKFKTDVSAFMDGEGNILGPFKANDIANIQEEIAKILIEDKKAVKIE
ncbi:MAG: hypothetical protein QXE64_01440 [Candidatus Pacearchaeota archaeon]